MNAQTQVSERLKKLTLNNINEERFNFFNLLNNNYIFGKRYYDKRGWEGNIIRFITNSKELLIKFAVKHTLSGNYPHIGITAQCGIAIMYRCYESNQWYHIDCVLSRDETGIFYQNMTKFDITSMYEILIYGPLIASLSELVVGIDERSHIDSKKDKLDVMLFLGGIHTFGVGCTSSALSFPNIVARKGKQYTIYNCSVNTRNHIEYINNNINSILPILEKASGVILEYDYIRQEIKSLKKINKLIEKIKSYNIPIVLWRVENFNSTLCKEKEKIINEVFCNISGLYIMSTQSIFENLWSEVCTLSENFINDTGNVLISKKLIEYMEDKNGIHCLYNRFTKNS